MNSTTTGSGPGSFPALIGLARRSVVLAGLIGQLSSFSADADPRNVLKRTLAKAAESLGYEGYFRSERSYGTFEAGTNLRAWLMRILTNLNIDRGRREQRAPDTRPMEEGDYFLYNRLEETSGTDDEERIAERLSQDSIVHALSNVPHDFRDAIVLVDIGDFSYQDAAQILDVPIGTVMSRLHRGRRILKRELAETAVGEES